MAESHDDTTAAPPERRPNRSLGRRLAFWLGLPAAVALVLVGAIAGGLWYLTQNTVVAPAWARGFVERSASEVMPEIDVSFSALRLSLSPALAPIVSIEGLVLRDPETLQVFEVSQLRGRADRSALLARKLVLTELDISGLSVTVQRALEGGVSLSLGAFDLAALAPVSADQPASTQDFESLLGLIDGALATPPFDKLARVSAQNVRLVYEDARADQTWVVDGGVIDLTQSDQLLALSGDFALLTGRSDLASISIDADIDRITEVATLGVRVDDAAASDIATQSPALAWMSVLDAPISGAFRVALTGDGLGPLNATLSIGQGAVTPTDDTRPIRFDKARTYFTYTPLSRRLDVSLLEVDSSLGRLVGEGSALLDETGGGRLGETIITQLTLSELQLSPEIWQGAGRDLSGATADVKISLNPFGVEIGQASVPVDGHVVKLRGDIVGDDEGWSVALDITPPKMRARDILALWPDSARPKTKAWFTKSLRDGVLQGGTLAWRDRAGQDRTIGGSFLFDGLDLQFMKDFPAIEAGRGTVTLQGNRLVVALEDGHLNPPQGGRIEGKGTTMVFEDLSAIPIQARIGLELSGTLTSVLSTLDEPPLRILSKANRAVTLGEGRAQVSGTIALPLKAKITGVDVGFDIAAEVSGFRSEEIVKGQVLRASSARVQASNSELSVGGDMRLGDVPVSGTWRLPLGKPGATSSFVGAVELSPRTLDTFKIALPPGTLRRQTQAAIKLSFPKGRPAGFTLSSDLRGLGITIPAVGWTKSPNASGVLTLDGVLGDAPVVNALVLGGPGFEARGSVSTRAGGGLDLARLEQLRVGDWLNARVDLVGRGKGVTPQVQLRSGRLDMRRAVFGAGSGGAATPIALNLDALTISDGIVLNDFSGQLQTGSGTSGTFTARVNGGARVAGTLIPSANGARIQITSEDAGGVLRSAGVLKNAVGGSLALNLIPTGRTGILDGALRVTGARLSDAPVMASILSAVSVVGLLEQLDGNGLVFDEVDAQFQLTPERLILTQSSAVGPSLGLSMDGTYRLADKTMDMQGVISPFYLLNSIGSILTRKGEGLFGVNFTLQGASDAPRVTVNPLSALTPGMFREIFRRPPPKTE